MSEVPDDLRYTSEHEWARLQDDRVVVGITDYAQDQLGDVVYVSLPEAGVQVTAGAACGEIESTKSVSDIYSPVTGTIAARNETLTEEPGTINQDPYGAGWLFEVTAEGIDLDGLLDAAGYRKRIEEA